MSTGRVGFQKNGEMQTEIKQKDNMREIIAILLCVLALTGCASSHNSESQQQAQTVRLLELQRQELIKEVNEMTMQRNLVKLKDGNILPGCWPEAVRKLKPVAVYHHMANVVIVLRKDGPSEEGYYVVPGISSWFPFQETDASMPGWSWKPVGDPFSGHSIFAYTRRKLEGA
ncbi:hypothetical protein Cflav_PD5855 [Pedosphaera parvula Ellin514]|uniref:Lipoprotein n=1 Tax=Pedosphaera parvula (strain Ellin514) TaxID=320771 RepID=B9X9P9_PEDPL|nr:hypothetical protein Cflav_PD5855 [Pedosphaera parvula Ellin514]